MQGIIKTWDAQRSFGWIRVASGKGYFCHIQNWEDSVPPSVGMVVRFEIGPGYNGRKEQAVNARQLTAQAAGADALVASLPEVRS